MMDKSEKERLFKLFDKLVSWKFAMKEVERYLKQDADYFTVSSGPWTIVYDSAKESEANNG
jgi:hypothetical protein